MIYSIVYNFADLSVLMLYKELTDWLDSQYEFYEKYGNLTYEDDCLFKKIEDLLRNIKDIARYYDKGYVDIFIRHRNPGKLNPKEMNFEEITEISRTITSTTKYFLPYENTGKRMVIINNKNRNKFLVLGLTEE